MTLKRYIFRCDCGQFETPTREPSPCQVCGKQPKRVYTAAIQYHPTHSKRSNE